jgi:predicted Zn-dependent peptidase
MVFKGAGGRSAREISEAIEDVGGDLNAYTERDATSFNASVLGEHVGLAVGLIADLIVRAHFDANDLAREKDVVLQELAEAQDTPSDIIFDELWSAAFADQPLGRSVLGDEAGLERISVADLHGWRQNSYRAGSLILSAAGRVDHDELVALAEARFADLPSGRADPAVPARFTPLRRGGRAKADQAQLTLGLAAPHARADDYLPTRMFADIVGGGASSRLFQAVREERGLAYTVSASLHPHDDLGLFYVHAATARRDAAAAAGLIEAVLEETTASLTQRELDRVRTQARAGMAMQLETPWGQASYAARQLAVHGRLIEPAEVIGALARLSVEDVRAAGQRLLAGERAAATIGVPAVRAA